MIAYPLEELVLYTCNATTINPLFEIYAMRELVSNLGIRRIVVVWGSKVQFWPGD
jgi:hypothetical protein